MADKNRVEHNTPDWLYPAPTIERRVQTNPQGGAQISLELPSSEVVVSLFKHISPSCELP